MPSVRPSNKSRSKSVSTRTGRSKSTKAEAKAKPVTKSSSKSTKPTPKSQPKKADKKSPVRDRSSSKTSAKVFKPAARQSTRGKIKPSSTNEPAQTSRSSPRKETRASEKSAGRTSTRTPAKSPRKASVSKSKQAEATRASKASPQKRASRSSKATQSPAKTTKESVIYNSPQSRPKQRSRGFQNKQDAKSPKARHESKDSSPSRSPVKSRNTTAKLSKASPARPSRSSKRATTPQKSPGRVPTRKTSVIEVETTKAKSPKKATPKKSPKKAPTPKKSPAKKPSVSKVLDVSIPDPVTGFKRDASGKLIRRGEDEARQKEIKNNLGMLLEDDECEVEIMMASKNMETEGSDSEDSEDEEATTTTRGYNLYEDWKLLVAVAKWITSKGGARGLLGVHAWSTMNDPLTGGKLLEGEKDAKSMCKRYTTALNYLREEEIEKIQDLGEKLSIKELKKLRLLFEKLDDGSRRLTGIFKPAKKDPRYYDKKLEMVIDAVNDIEDYSDDEKERRRVEKEASQEEAEEKEIKARKSPRKKQRKNDGNEAIVVRQEVQKKPNKAEQKRLEEQEFKILKEDWQYESKSLTASDVFRTRKFEGQFEYDANFTTYVDHTQGFRQFVKEDAEPEVVQSKISTQNKWGRLSGYAQEYGFSFEDVLTIFNSVSCDAKDLETYLQTEDRSLLWTSQEDKDLAANNPIAMRYLIKIKGPLRITKRREYLKEAGLN